MYLIHNRHYSEHKRVTHCNDKLREIKLMYMFT